MAWAIEWEGEISSQQNNTPQMHVVSKDGRKMSSVLNTKKVGDRWNSKDVRVHREGLRGRLKPPWRFMYCRYSIFFSFRTP